jgi:ATP phosphoribosyltransferase
MLNIALPKGRLGERAYELFEKIGFGCPDILENKRKLVFQSENKDGDVRYFLVKPSDVAIYVENGAADIGVAGKDVLLESSADIYELLDLGFGKCRVAIAAPEGWMDRSVNTLRVATKYPNIAQKYYASKSRKIRVIKLNGSMEIAPCVNLADVIVDIVETGNTLKENNLRVVEQIAESSARFIANKSSYQFKGALIREIAEKLEREIGLNENNKI